MITTLELYQEIERQQIVLAYFPLPENESVSLQTGQGAYIGLDPDRLETASQERVLLAHETGHCATGAFYNRHSKLCHIGQQEHKADAWAAKKLLPWEELDEAMQSGLVEVWQLAEQFAVTEDFVRRALSIYAEEGLYAAP